MKGRWKVTLALSVMILTYAGTAMTAQWANPGLLVDAAAVKANIDKADWVVVDARGLKDYVKGHIPGAINKYRQLDESFTGLSKDRNNIIYCYSEECHLAASAAREFAEHGYPVIELEGGFESWKMHNLPVEVQPWTKPETKFTSTEEMQEQEEPEEEQSSWPEEQEEE